MSDRIDALYDEFDADNADLGEDFPTRWQPSVKGDVLEGRLRNVRRIDAKYGPTLVYDVDAESAIADGEEITDETGRGFSWLLGNVDAKAKVKAMAVQDRPHPGDWVRFEIVKVDRNDQGNKIYRYSIEVTKGSGPDTDEKPKKAKKDKGEKKNKKDKKKKKNKGGDEDSEREFL